MIKLYIPKNCFQLKYFKHLFYFKLCVCLCVVCLSVCLFGREWLRAREWWCTRKLDVSEPLDLELQEVVSHFVSQIPCKSNTHSTTESSFQPQIFFKHLFIYLFILCQSTCGGQRLTHGSQFFSSTMWVLGSDSGRPAWHQAPLLIESARWLLK